MPKTSTVGQIGQIRVIPEEFGGCVFKKESERERNVLVPTPKKKLAIIYFGVRISVCVRIEKNGAGDGGKQDWECRQ